MTELDGEVQRILLLLGYHSDSHSRAPKLSDLSRTPGEDSIEISVKPGADIEDFPLLWHHELSLLKQKLEGPKE